MLNRIIVINSDIRLHTGVAVQHRPGKESQRSKKFLILRGYMGGAVRPSLTHSVFARPLSPPLAEMEKEFQTPAGVYPEFNVGAQNDKKE